jgi:hypothetical protein
MHMGFGGETWGERDDLEDLRIDVRIILKYILKI